MPRPLSSFREVPSPSLSPWQRRVPLPLRPSFPKKGRLSLEIRRLARLLFFSLFPADTPLVFSAQGGRVFSLFEGMSDRPTFFLRRRPFFLPSLRQPTDISLLFFFSFFGQRNQRRGFFFFLGFFGGAWPWPFSFSPARGTKGHLPSLFREDVPVGTFFPLAIDREASCRDSQASRDFFLSFFCPKVDQVGPASLFFFFPPLVMSASGGYAWPFFFPFLSAGSRGGDSGLFLFCGGSVFFFFFGRVDAPFPPSFPFLPPQSNWQAVPLFFFL